MHNLTPGLLRPLICLAFLLYFHLSSVANVVILNGLSHEFTVTPGHSYRGKIELQNAHKEKTQSVRAYLKDYSFRHTGEVFYDEPGKIKRSNAAWITFNPNFLSLGGNEKGTIHFEIDVPAMQNPVGSYWSVIVVEGLNPAEDKNSRYSLQVNTVVRYAIQVIITFSNAGEGNLNFLEPHLSREGDTKILKIPVENKGDYLMRPYISVQLFDENGSSVGKFQSEKRKLFPDTSCEFSLPVKKLVPGHYKAVLIAETGEEDLFGANIILEVEDD